MKTTSYPYSFRFIQFETRRREALEWPPHVAGPARRQRRHRSGIVGRLLTLAR